MTQRPKPVWAVGHVLAGHEASVKQRLTLHGCTAYLPVLTRLCRFAGRRKPELVETPLFPTYVFLDTRTVDDWGKVHDDRIIGILGLVDESEIDRVRTIEGEGLVEPVRDPLPVFVIGEMLRVVDGSAFTKQGRVWRADKTGVWLCNGDFTWPTKFTDLTNLARCA